MTRTCNRERACVCWLAGGHTLIRLRTDALTNPWKPRLMCEHIHTDLILPFAPLSSALNAKAAHTRHVFFFPSPALIEVTIPSFCTKEDKKSVVSLAPSFARYYYSTQYSMPTHTRSGRSLFFVFLFFFPESHSHCVFRGEFPTLVRLWSGRGIKSRHQNKVRLNIKIN